MEIINQFQKELDKLGAKARFFSVEHLKELEEETNLLIDNKLSGKKINEKYLNNYFEFSSLYNNPDIKSICITATPSPQNTIQFEFEDTVLTVEMPPVFVDRKEILNDIIHIASNLLPSFGYCTYPVVLPKKPMAVHSGLARYGKNNLVYVDGMGSYLRLTAFATDIPCTDDNWSEFQVLDTCKTCGACEKNCPTKAINSHDFLIDADKCIDMYNEQPEPFPDWIDLSWHNCLVGCLRCQIVCPHNRHNKHPKDIIETFNIEETRLILDQIPFDQLPISLKEKLNRLCLNIYYDKLSRNLTALYQKSKNKD